MGTAASTLAAAPLTCTLAAAMSALFFYMWNTRVGLDAVSLTYNRVAKERQYYRLLSAAVTHVDVMHILFNMGSLLNLAPLEAMMGSLWYLETTLLLLYGSMGAWMLSVHVASTRYGLAAWAESPVVGYSGVIFGWMTLAGMLQPTGTAFGLPITLAPFLALVLTQLIVPRASFLGHLAGIVAGYATGWGLLESARGYWLWVATLGAAGACVLSLRSTALGPALARFVAISPAYAAALEAGGLGGAGEGGEAPQGAPRARIVGGVLTQWRASGREELAATASTAGPSPAPPPPPPPPPPQQQQQQQHTGLPVAGAELSSVGGAAGGALAAPQGQGAAAAAQVSTSSNDADSDSGAALLSRHV